MSFPIVVIDHCKSNDVNLISDVIVLWRHDGYLEIESVCNVSASWTVYETNIVVLIKAGASRFVCMMPLIF